MQKVSSRIHRRYKRSWSHRATICGLYKWNRMCCCTKKIKMEINANDKMIIYYFARIQQLDATCVISSFLFQYLLVMLHLYSTQRQRVHCSTIPIARKYAINVACHRSGRIVNRQNRVRRNEWMKKKFSQLGCAQMLKMVGNGNNNNAQCPSYVLHHLDMPTEREKFTGETWQCQPDERRRWSNGNFRSLFHFVS